MFGQADRALAWARRALANSEAEPLDALVLLAYVLGARREVLLAHPETPLTPDQSAAYCDLVARRAAGMPVAYLVGARAFYDRDLAVTPAVLIPRPETEHLVEAALEWAHGRAGLRLVDVGTGSGALVVTLLAHLPEARAWAVDVSAAALDVARRNAAQASLLDRITWAQGDLLEPLIIAGSRADLIVANLPYVPSGDLDGLAVARWEPRLALDGGADGLDLIRRLLNQAPAILAPVGLLLLEIGAGQGERVAALARAALPGADVRVLPDYAGLDRVVRIERDG